MNNNFIDFLKQSKSVAMNWFKFVPSFHELKKNRFVHNVAMLSGGTALSQLMAVVFLPIITRLYGPEAFGILGVFVSIVAIFLPIVSLTYGYAIVIPASDSDAWALLNLSLRIGIGIFIISAVIFGGFHHQIARAMGFDAAAPYLLLVPLVLLFSTVNEVFQQQLIRKNKFRSISSVAVIQSAVMGTSKIGVGALVPTAQVLMILTTIGYIFNPILLWPRVRSTLLAHRNSLNFRRDDQVKSFRTIAHAYCDFPLYRAPRALLKSISKNFPVLVFSVFFGPVFAGFYTLANRILTYPCTFISESVGKVFFPRIAEAIHRKEKIKPLILKATGGLALIGLLPFGLIFLFGPMLFRFIFGSAWITPGKYAQWLVLWEYFVFISAPSMYAIPLLGLQGQLLAYEILSFVIRMGMLLLGAIVLSNDMSTIALFSITNMFLLIGLLAWVLSRSNSSLRGNLRRESDVGIV